MRNVELEPYQGVERVAKAFKKNAIFKAERKGK